MQASNVLLNKVYCTSSDEAVPTPASLSYLSIFACLLIMAASAQEAGKVPSSEIQPFDNSFSDLSLSEVTDHFEKRLARSDKSQAPKLARLVLELSHQHQFSPTFILSVIEAESSFRTGVISKAGAVGLMQLLPATAKETAERYNIRSYKSEADLHNPAVNIRLGVAYMSYLRKQFGNSLHYVAAYNMGPTALRRKIRNNDYELGALDHYVRTIHERTRAMRDNRISEKLPAVRLAEGMLASAF